MPQIESGVVGRGEAIKELRRARKWTQEALADKTGYSKRTIENAEAGKRVQEAVLECIAEALEVPIAAVKDEAATIRKAEATVRSEAHRFLSAIEGSWWATCHEYPGRSYQGVEVPGFMHEWVFELKRSGNGLSGQCHCKTVGFEHGQFFLVGGVDAQGFVTIDGTRDVGDAAIFFFRSLLQFHSDGRTKRMNGGYVVYNGEHRSIFLGRIDFAEYAPPEK